MIYKRKKCEFCEKMFLTKSISKKYCCGECKKKASQGKRKRKEQLCWRCQRACGGCSWSRYGKLPSGCVVRPSFKKEKDGYERRTYHIVECPLFIEDEE